MGWRNSAFTTNMTERFRSFLVQHICCFAMVSESRLSFEGRRENTTQPIRSSSISLCINFGIMRLASERKESLFR